MAALNVTAHIARQILVIRGQKVMIDADLAALYDVPTKRLNEQVKRNPGRFPRDFVFALTRAERDEVVANCDHLQRLKFSPTMPFAFTEHGALMAASVLNTPRAVEVSLYVVRVFVELREALAAHKGLAAKLEELEQKTEALALRHDTLAANTRAQLRQVFDAIRELMSPREPLQPVTWTPKIAYSENRRDRHRRFYQDEYQHPSSRRMASAARLVAGAESHP